MHDSAFATTEDEPQQEEADQQGVSLTELSETAIIIVKTPSVIIAHEPHGPHASTITLTMHGASAIEALPHLDLAVTTWLTTRPSPCHIVLDLRHYPRLISWDLGLLYKWYDTVTAHKSVFIIAGLSAENLRKCQLVGLDVVMQLKLVHTAS